MTDSREFVLKAGVQLNEVDAKHSDARAASRQSTLQDARLRKLYRNTRRVGVRGI
jgi:hypothetical protein